ncbi:MAG TPA: DMT family transporter [Acidimicrobiales bacterium]|nr:DMT family transporter [Acidimicrobiales bacterium]
MTLVILAALSATLAGSGDFCGGLASRGGRVSAVATNSLIIGMFSALIMAPFLGGSPDRTGLLWGAGAGIAGGLAIHALYQGLTHAGAGVVSPIAAVGSAAWPVLYSIVTGDRPGPLQSVGVGIGVVAIWLISRTSGKGPVEAHADGRRGVKFGIAAGLGFGTMLIMLSRVSTDAGMWPLVSARAAGFAILALLALGARHPLVPVRGTWWAIAGSGVFTVLANAFFIAATRRGSLATVSVITSMFPASTVVLARLVWKERLTRANLAGLGLSLTAVALIVA